MNKKITQHIALSLILVLLPLSVSVGFQHYHPEHVLNTVDSTFQCDHGHEVYQPSGLCQVCHFFSSLTPPHSLSLSHSLESSEYLLPIFSKIFLGFESPHSFGRAPPSPMYKG